MTQSLRIVFAGTPAFAADHLEALLGTRHRVIAVLTQPDRRSGRGKALRPGPVKVLAQAHDIPVHQPAALDDASATDLLEPLDADVMVVVAYGLLLPPAALQLPRHGCLNIHASLLPRWRGAAPIERAMLAGDTETGVTLMQMDAGLDTGDILLQASLPITESTTGEQLTEDLSRLGRELLCRGLDQLAESGALPATPQDDSLSTHAAKLRKEEAAVDWSQSAAAIQRKILALYPRMPAYTAFNGDRIRLISAREVSTDLHESAFRPEPGCLLTASPQEGLVVQCGQGVLAITRLQLPGKNPVAVADLLNAHRDRFTPGQSFGPADSG